MTIKQESDAEKIIQIHKDNNEKYNWSGNLDDNNFLFRSLINKGLVVQYAQGATCLTSYGRSFTTFEKERLEEAKRKQINDDKDDYDLRQKKFIFKWRYFPYFISSVALIVSICSYFKPEKKQQDLQPMQTEILVLTKRVTKMDSLFRADSLSRKRKK